MTPARTILDWLTPLDRIAILAVGLGAGILGGLMQGWGEGVLIGLMAGLCLAIARIDGAHLTIPDLLVLPLAALGLVSSILQGAPLPARLMAMGAVAVVLLAVRAVLSRRRGRNVLGLGDVKLVAAAAAWLPAELLPAYVLLSSLSGLAELLFRRSPDGSVPFGRHLAPWLFFCTMAQPWLLTLVSAP